MIIDKNSWHYKWLCIWGDAVRVDRVSDSCEYIRRLINSILLALLAVGVLALSVGVLALSVGDTLAWIAAMIATQQFIAPEYWAGVTVAVGVMTGIVAVVLYGWNWYAPRTNRQDKKPPGVVKQAWQQYQDKICTRVEFIDHTDKRE